MVRHDQITTENFEVAISAFVTACYSDRVILNSLEETSWDDAYTFTLRGALGSNHQAHKDLPENVNYSTPDEDNIAIGDTQRELIKQFETLLSTHIVSAPLLEKCLTTFHQELDTLSALASLLKQESLLCGPAFAKKNDLAGNLKRSLEALYLQTKNEVALDAAACYNTSKTTDDLTGNYVQARLCAQAIAKAFKDGRYAQVSSALYAGFENDLKQFKSLKEKTESDLELAIREAFRQSQESEALMHALEDLRGHIKASDSINRHYADLVANICIGKTNNDEIQPLPALKMMEKGYRASPNNSFVCRNLIALIRMNLMSAINDSHTQEAAMYTCMDGLKAHKSDSFKIAAQELADTRDEILLQLIRSQGSDFAWLLTGHTPNNITAAGRKLKKVIGYFNELSGTAPNLQTLLSN